MSTSWSYDAIAEVYATDMGQSMPFDDVGFYRDLCVGQGGTALELGCGTGRILLELLAARVDVCGMDRSLPMLQRLHRDAQPRGLTARVMQGDLRTLPFTASARFTTILLLYSLITYLTDSAAAIALFNHPGKPAPRYPAREAARVRAMAHRYEAADPRFASELYAAADRHEMLYGD
jgi:SAM-dependent methyltransferase